MATPSDLANTNLYSFLCVFTVYFICLFYFIISGKDYTITTIYMFVLLFLIVTFIVQLGCNTYLTSRKEICGKTDISVAFSSTTYPWIFVYSILMILVVTIPGWLRLFSNTFGIYAANAYGLRELLSKSFFIIANKNTKNIDPTLVNIINSIYNDPILLINELEPSDFILNRTQDNNITSINWKSYDKMVSTGLFNITNSVKEVPASPSSTSAPASPPAGQAPSTSPSIEDKIELHKIILLKDTVGISFWLFLGGIITVLISTNTLLNSRCKQLGKEQYNSIFNN